MDDNQIQGIDIQNTDHDDLLPMEEDLLANLRNITELKSSSDMSQPTVFHFFTMIIFLTHFILLY